MNWLVLAKPVADLETVPVEPRHHTVVRESAELSLNPLDRRAVRVALELREPGEKVTVLAMGPAHAAPGLAEMFAHGVDRAVLLTDPAFAGSDTLATASALRRAASRLPHDLVLGGCASTDSGTGQVAAEVAALMDRPFVGDARRIVRAPQGPWTVEADTPTGWARLNVAPPFVLAVGEKILKPPRAADDLIAAARARPVEQWSAADLGLSTSETGLRGSPTSVVGLTEEAPIRRGEVFPAGAPGASVAAAVALVERIATATESPAPGPAPLPTDRREDREVLVFVTSEEGRLDPETLPAVLEVRRRLPGFWPSALWVGPAPDARARERLAAAGAASAAVVAASEGWRDPVLVATDAQTVLRSRRRASAALFPSSPFGRAVAATLAARGGHGLTGDATGLSAGGGGRVDFLKPAFGGRQLAVIATRRHPAMATVRPGAFRPGTVVPASPFPIVEHASTGATSRVERVAHGTELDESWGDLGRAHVVIAAGQGVGGPEAFEEIRRVARRWHGAVAATRRVVEAGWVPRQLQVGLTGRAIAPDLAVLLGVGGSPNHVVGWRRARAVLAVDRSAESGVFRASDAGIVGDWREVLALLAPALQPLADRLAGY